MQSVQPSHLEPAYVLHSRAYSNTSLLVDCFTLNFGWFTAVVKGARTRSRAYGGTIIQPFTPLQVKWRGRGEVKTLTDYEAADQAILLKGKRLYCALYLNELIIRLLGKYEPFPSLFAYYTETLAKLSSDEEIEVILRRFELELLDSLGYGLIPGDRGESESQIHPNQRYSYLHNTGLQLANTDSNLSVSGETLIALSSGSQLNHLQKREARELMRYVLSCYLGSKPLKSRELFSTF